MRGTRLVRFARRLVTVAASAVLLVGCEGDGGGGLSADVGDNDPNVVVALGDSITSGHGATPYPSLLTGMIGRTVVNSGVPGERAAGGAARVASVLARHKPGYLLIMLGSNDAIHASTPGPVATQLRSIVEQAKANHTVPIISTIPSMISLYSIFQGAVEPINAEIRAIGSEPGVYFVDSDARMGQNPDLYFDNGLHPNDAGHVVIAEAFAAVF